MKYITPCFFLNGKGMVNGNYLQFSKGGGGFLVFQGGGGLLIIFPMKTYSTGWSGPHVRSLGQTMRMLIVQLFNIHLINLLSCNMLPIGFNKFDFSR